MSDYHTAPDSGYSTLASTPAANTSYSAPPSSDPNPYTTQNSSSAGQANPYSGQPTAQTTGTYIPSPAPAAAAAAANPDSYNYHDTHRSSIDKPPASNVPPPDYIPQTNTPNITPALPIVPTQQYTEKSATVTTAAPGAMAQPSPYGAAAAAAGLPVARGPPTEFQAGLCDCWGDFKLCFCASCCSPCLFNRTTAVMDRDRAPMALSLDDAEKEWFGLNCVGYYLLAAWTGCGQIFWQGHRRGLLRRKYNIKGSSGNDYLLSCCCTPCALGQEDIEVRRIEREKLLEFQNAQQTLASQNL